MESSRTELLSDGRADSAISGRAEPHRVYCLGSASPAGAGTVRRPRFLDRPPARTAARQDGRAAHGAAGDRRSPPRGKAGRPPRGSLRLRLRAPLVLLAACAALLGGHRAAHAQTVWSGTMTVGQLVLSGVALPHYGYSSSVGYGSLDDTDFTRGSDSHTILGVIENQQNKTFSVALNPGLSSDDVAILEFHVGSTSFSFSDAAVTTSASDVTYAWSSSLSLSDNDTVALKLVDSSVAPDTTAPTLESATVAEDGTTIELLFDEDYSANSAINMPASAFSVTAGGNSVTVGNLHLVQEADFTYHRVQLGNLSPAITAGQAVVVTYTDPTTGDDASVIEDAAGNDVASFTTGSGGVPAVVNNVLPAATIEANRTTVTEGEDITITARLSPTVLTAAETIPLTVTDVNSALTRTPTGFTIAANESESTLTFATTDNSDEDGSREVVFAIGRSADDPYTLGTPSTVTVTVLDNDGGPSPPQLRWTVPRPGAVNLQWDPPEDDGGQPVTGYDYRHSDDGGNTWIDWQPVPDDGLYGLFVIHIVRDLALDTEYTFEVRARNAGGVSDPSNQLKETPAVGVRFRPATSTTVNEGDDVRVTVELAAARPAPVTVWLTAVPGDYVGETGRLVADDDYTPAVPGQLTIPAGQRSASFDLRITDDDEGEPAEAVVIELEPPDGYMAWWPSLEVIVRESDGGGELRLPYMSVDDASGRESGTGGRIVHVVPGVAAAGGGRAGDGGLRHRGRDGDGRRGLRGSERNAHLRAGRKEPVGRRVHHRRRGAGRRGDVHAEVVEHDGRAGGATWRTPRRRARSITPRSRPAR